VKRVRRVRRVVKLELRGIKVYRDHRDRLGYEVSRVRKASRDLKVSSVQKETMVRKAARGLKVIRVPKVLEV
jgi:hypothetical protein